MPGGVRVTLHSDYQPRLACGWGTLGQVWECGWEQSKSTAGGGATCQMDPLPMGELLTGGDSHLGDPP